MPLLLMLLAIAVGLGWLCSPAGRRPAVPLAVVAAPGWDARCRQRLEAARVEAAADGSFDRFAGGTIEAGPGEVWYRLELPGGVRYSAGAIARAGGDLEDSEWYSLHGAVPPAERFSLWRDRGRRSGYLAGADAAALRRSAFVLVFEQAIDDCLEPSAPGRDD